MTGGMVEYGFDRGPDSNRGIYTVDIAGPEVSYNLEQLFHHFHEFISRFLKKLLLLFAIKANVYLGIESE